METYDLQTEVPVRFRDLDTMGHVNNAIYATYVEEARAAYYDDVVDSSLSDVDTVLVNLEIDFRKPILEGDTVTVFLTVDDLGESSIPMDYRLEVDGETVATARSVQVVVDEARSESVPIPDWMRDRMTT